MHVPELPEESRFRFHVRLKTRWSDEDNQCVLNNAVYMTLLEEGRYAYFSQLGLVSDNHFPFVLAQTNICFLHPGRGGRDIDLSVATMHLGTRSFTQVVRLQEADGGPVLVEAEARLVSWDSAAQASCPMAADFRSAVAAFEGLDAS